LESNPDLLATLVADLPDKVFIESSDKPSLTICSSTQRDEIGELQTSHLEMGLLMQHPE